MSRWQRVGLQDDVAYVRRGADVCMAIVYKRPGFGGGFAAQAEVNPNETDSRFKRGWAGATHHDRESARRVALRACGRMLRALNK